MRAGQIRVAMSLIIGQENNKIHKDGDSLDLSVSHGLTQWFAHNSCLIDIEFINTCIMTIYPPITLNPCVHKYILRVCSIKSMKKTHM